MKKLLQLSLLAACLATALTAQAQLLSDFSSTAGWGTAQQVFGDVGTIQISGGVANYTTTSDPEENEQFSYIQYTASTLSFDTSWSVRVDVKYADPAGIFTLGSQQFINLGLLVTPGSATIGVDEDGPTFNGFMAASNLYSNPDSDTPVYGRDFRTTRLAANGEVTDADAVAWFGGVNGATSTAVILSYNASTHILSAGFDGNTGNGYDNYPMGTDTVDVVGDWGMTESDTFSLYLFGNSGWDEAGTEASPMIALGAATFDNLTAIPEPSTYAALAGALALGVAAWRRRQRGTTV